MVLRYISVLDTVHLRPIIGRLRKLFLVLGLSLNGGRKTFIYLVFEASLDYNEAQVVSLLKTFQDVFDRLCPPTIKYVL